ncbi:MAG: hypothetical protein Q7R30_11985 [Acidobacteriota bacterium]|nr:hypothetical protein [Acidobacteriota bacterium]
MWRTCLREITFVDQGTIVPPTAALFQGEAAYSHLLEVICGLGSPIIGETEVMSQFKAFVVGLQSEHAAIRDVSERLLADAKTIRARHLVGLGSRSYGSAVRRRVRDCSRIALVGTGMLAGKILPFLRDDGRQLDLWGRRDSLQWDVTGITYRRIDANAAATLAGRTAIVVAAPIPSSGIGRLRARYADVVRLIDLRAEGRLDPPPPFPSVVTLDDIFVELNAAAQISDQCAASAREEVRRCAHAFVTRATLHPSGWHDLCA